MRLRGESFNRERHGNRAVDYLAAGGAPLPRTKAARADTRTISQYYSEWIERRSAPVVRASAERDYRLALRAWSAASSNP